jgi:murein DD-endopeptidase MepM/ murein hydrolase activator NlpD
MIYVSAKTVGDVKKELQNLETQAQDNENKIKYTETQINQAKKDIVQINIDMDNISAEIIAKNKEIENLNVEIQNKEAETKKLMEYIQLSNGQSFYLEYVVGAETLTDFIYRMSVTEQLSKYNSDLIIQMNNMIKANENRKIELNNKTIELNNKQKELGVNLKILASQKVKLDEFDRSIEDEIAIARENLQEYLNAGCKDSDDISVCVDIPSDSGFTRPFVTGYVTSEFSLSRINPITHSSEPHAAIDVSSSNKSSKVYSVANGKVFATFYDYYGGNTVVIHHKIRTSSGYKYYTSTYCHLAGISVKKGDIVYRSSQIGIMGNTGRYTTGAHTHLAISTGRRYIDYVAYDDYVAHSINPRIVISFPAGTYNAWNGR